MGSLPTSVQETVRKFAAGAGVGQPDFSNLQQLLKLQWYTQGEGFEIVAAGTETFATLDHLRGLARRAKALLVEGEMALAAEAALASASAVAEGQ